MSRIVIVALLSTSLPAFAAQPLKSDLVVETVLKSAAGTEAGPEVLVGIESCQVIEASEADVLVTFQLADELGEERFVDAWLLELRAKDRAVRDCSDGDCLLLTDLADVSDDRVEVRVDPQTLLQGTNCTGDRDVFVRVELLEDVKDDDAFQAADLRIRFDLTAPEAPTILRADAADDFVEIELGSTPDEVVRWHVVAGPSDDEEPSTESLRRLGTAGGSESTIMLDDVALEVGTPLNVYVYGEDSAGNISDLSAPALVEPLEAIDFWEEAGGEGASCSSTAGPAGLAPLFLFLVGLTFTRRRLRALVVTLVTVPATVSAQTGFVEVGAGPYAPPVTRTEAFDAYFGEHGRWVVGASGGAMLLERPWFSAGLEGGIGYSRFAGHSIAGDLHFADGSTLTLFPATLGPRITTGDALGPFSLAAGGGLAATIYRFGNHGGVATAADGTIGRGTQWGWYTSLQASLSLDPLAPQSAYGLGASWGIDDTRVFATLHRSTVDDFGRGNLALGGTRAVFGLGFGF